MSVLKALAKRKHLLFALPALILIFGLTFTTYHVKGFSLTKSIASAATTCSGWNCDNQDPTQTQNLSGTLCSSNATTVLSALLSDGSLGTTGVVEMRWGNACQTNWSRLTNYVGNGSQVWTGWWHNRLYVTSGNCLAYQEDTYDGYFTTDWTNQQYAPTTSVEAYGDIQAVHNNWPNGTWYTFSKNAVANPGWGAMC